MGWFGYVHQLTDMKDHCMCEIDAVFLVWSPITCLHKVPIGKSSDYSHEYIDGFLRLNFLKFYFMYFSHFLNRVL